MVVKHRLYSLPMDPLESEERTSAHRSAPASCASASPICIPKAKVRPDRFSRLPPKHIVSAPRGSEDLMKTKLVQELTFLEKIDCEKDSVYDKREAKGSFRGISKIFGRHRLSFYPTHYLLRLSFLFWFSSFTFLH